MEKIIKALMDEIDEGLALSSYKRIATESGVSQSTVWRVRHGFCKSISTVTMAKIFDGIKKIKQDI